MLLASIDHDEQKKREAEDALTSMSLLAELKQVAFFGDVHYESSIEGDVLLPLDKVVKKGSATYCNVSADIEGVGKELDTALGHLLRADVVCCSFYLWRAGGEADGRQLDAVKTTLSYILANAMAEADNPIPTSRNYAERRHFSIVVGHLGGICSSQFPFPVTSSV